MKIITPALFVFLLISDTLTAQTKMSVTIGKQEWMIKNLDVAMFRNGEPIPEAKTDKEWVEAGENKQPAWCYYNNDPANGAKYGKLYNWYAVADPRGLCPAGWHVPSYGEWYQLIVYLGGYKKAGKKMKAKEGWVMNGNGNNSSGFTGLPGGIRDGDDGIIRSGSFAGDLGYNGIWWSSTEPNTSDALGLELNYSIRSAHSFLRVDGKWNGLSVRCVANDIIIDIEPD
jgi:uncharacterized protein (TIGR02145 family)